MMPTPQGFKVGKSWTDTCGKEDTFLGVRSGERWDWNADCAGAVVSTLFCLYR